MAKKKEKIKPPKLPSLREMSKGIWHDMVTGLKTLKRDLPHMKTKLKNPVKTQYELGVFHAKQGHLTDAHLRFWLATRLDKNHAKAWTRLGWVYFCKNKLKKATHALEKALQLDPTLEVARFWLDNVNDKTDIKTIPLQVIEEDADRSADIYDRLFLVELQYKGYELIANSLLDDLEGKSVLDLGCGTGLCGRLLKTKAARVVGVDISEHMLEYAHHAYIAEENPTEETPDTLEKKEEITPEEELAQEKKSPPVKAYDALSHQDIISYLKETDETFDAITAAYVFNFFSDLSELFSCCKRALNSGAALVFSIESTDDAEYKFDARTGMFVHSKKYIRKTLDENGLKVIKEEAAELYSDCHNGMVYYCQLADDVKQSDVGV